MQIKDVLQYLEQQIPLAYAEDFDNVGLLVGNKNNTLKGILVSLDTLEAVVDEAIQKKCNLIISFHPIIFKGLKQLTGNTYVQRTVEKAIKHDISIYAIHTALDNHSLGVNNMICEQLGLINRKILIPQSSTIKKLTTYVPQAQAESVRESLFNEGAGSIGKYSHCSFSTSGKGSFKANDDANPFVGKKGKTHFEDEVQLNITYQKHLEPKILKSLFEHHPYEEVAYEIETLENENQDIGIGMLGEFEQPKSINETLKFIKTKFNPNMLRHSRPHKKQIKRIAVLGGSGAFGISHALSHKADLFMTADLKYHDFFRAENKITLVDVGHYESEQYTKELIHALLQKKFHNFAIVLSNINTNPIQYF